MNKYIFNCCVMQMKFVVQILSQELRIERTRFDFLLRSTLFNFSLLYNPCSLFTKII